MLTQFLFVYLLSWIPLIFSTIILVIIIFNFFSKHLSRFLFIKKISSPILIKILIGATIFFNLALSILQYLVWHNHPFTALFLAPHQPWSYFLGYAFFHFWFADVLALLSTGLVYLILLAFKKYKEEIISNYDLSLFALACLLLGWPKTIIFVPLFLILAVIDSAMDKLIFHNKRITLSASIVTALLLVFLFGNYLISFFHLSMLII